MGWKWKHPFRIQLLAIIVWTGIWLPSVTAQAQLQAADAKQIESVSISEDQTSLQVTIKSTGALTYSSFKQVDPLAIVIYIPQADVSRASLPADIKGDIVKKITGSFFSDKPPAYSKIEISLAKDTPHTVTRLDTGIVVTLQKDLASSGRKEEVERKTGPEPSKLPESAASQPSSAPPAEAVVDVTADVSEKNRAKVVIVADGRLPEIESFTLGNPPRLVVDIPGVRLQYPKRAWSLEHPLVKRIRMAQRQQGVRIVLDCAKPKLPFTIDEAAGSITVWIGKEKGAVQVKASQARGTIEALNFEPLDQGRVRITVKADRKLPYQIIPVDKKNLLLRLSGALLPKSLSRPYDTSYFEGAVEAIVPEQSRSAKDTVDVNIALRDAVPYQATEKADSIQLEFEATTVPPKADQLAKVEEGVAPKAEKPQAEETSLPAEFTDLATDSALLAEKGEGSMKEDSGAGPQVELPFGPEKVYTGQKISLDFQNADIHNVLHLLREISKLNIVVGEDVSGKVTLHLDNVPWDQALDVVLAAKGLGMIRKGNVVRVHPLDKIAKEEKLFIESKQAKLEADRKAREAEKEARETEPLLTEYIPVSYGDAGELTKQIKPLHKDGSITYDKRTNNIIIKDTATGIENAKVLVKKLDEPTRQVLIEARIVEATADFSRELGVQWGSGSDKSNLFERKGNEWTVGAQGRLGSNFAVNPGIPSSPMGALGFTFGRAGTALVNLDVRLLAMESDGKVHIISSPKITTLDNKEAYIKQGTKIPYEEKTAEGTVSTAFADATLSLTVVPHITPDGRINLTVTAKKDEPDWSNAVKNVPSIETREAKTELLINNGETVVIGGILYEKKTDTTAGVPGLSKIPILGWLFKGERDKTNRKELLIFISANTIKVD